jgi:hypothetical protein
MVIDSKFIVTVFWNYLTKLLLYEYASVNYQLQTVN